MLAIEQGVLSLPLDSWAEGDCRPPGTGPLAGPRTGQSLDPRSSRRAAAVQPWSVGPTVVLNTGAFMESATCTRTGVSVPLDLLAVFGAQPGRGRGWRRGGEGHVTASPGGMA